MIPTKYNIIDRMIGQTVIIENENLTIEELIEVDALLDKISIIIHRFTEKEIEEESIKNDIKIEDIEFDDGYGGLNSRIVNSLKAQGIEYLSQLKELKDKDLLCLRGSGRRSFSCIKAALKRLESNE